jgi:hypothetical protein
MYTHIQYAYIQTGFITGQGQVLATSTNPLVKFGIGVGSSMIEMKLTIPIGNEPGNVECGGSGASSEFEPIARRNLNNERAAQSSLGRLDFANSSTPRRSHASSHAHGAGYQDGDSLEIGSVSLRQSALDVRVLVIPANIGVLSDPFANINYSPMGIRGTSGNGGGSNRGGNLGKQSSDVASPSTQTQKSSNLRLSDIINANTLTGVVVGTVTMAVANSVASSSASSSAGMGNAFQMIGHAQCELSSLATSLAHTDSACMKGPCTLSMQYHSTRLCSSLLT